MIALCCLSTGNTRIGAFSSVDFLMLLLDLLLGSLVPALPKSSLVNMQSIALGPAAAHVPRTMQHHMNSLACKTRGIHRGQELAAARTRSSTI